MIRICHLSSAHPADDVRIFHKECRSLVMAGFDVHLVVPAEHDLLREGVQIHAVRKAAGGRFMRMLVTTFRVYRRALALQSHIYHFHDPELLPWGVMLRLSGAKVIYDVHEDLPRDIFSKPWIPAFLRLPAAWVVEGVENFLARRMSLIVAATPHIRDRFSSIGCRSIDVSNYPMLGELASSSGDDFSAEARPAVCYAGGITGVRGSREMVVAADLACVKILLAGNMSQGERERLAVLPGWSGVEERGYLSRSGVSDLYAESFAGLVVLHPEPNYLPSQPVKMYEYMSAGIPVIASDFPMWRRVIEDEKCGICVDPLNPESISAGIRLLNGDRELAKRMGENGRRAICETYNWGVEERKLISAYQELCGGSDA